MVCTYNPSSSHLIIALQSALLQKNIKMQIVITDDGSDSFDAETIIEFFYKKDFHDFTISRLVQNSGTVKNFRNGLKYCKGEYIRDLSPEDYLYGYNTLREWIDFIQEKDVGLSFSNVICYRLDNERILPVKREAHPQCIRNYYHGKWEYNYLIFNDLCVGTGMLIKRTMIDYYTHLIEGKVIYAEDNAYRIMAYQHVHMAFYDKPTVLYEVGNGISTSHSSTWREKLHKDWDKANNLMLELEQSDEAFLRQFRQIIRISKERHGIQRKMAKLFVPGYLIFAIKRKLFTRFTVTEVDQNYIMDLLKD